MKNSRLYIIFISLAVIVYSSCKYGKTYNNANEMASDVKTDIKIISVQEFRKIMGKGGDFNLIDCRGPGEVKSGYMPGAINVPRGMLEFDITKIFPLRGTKIYIYCKSGGRSALAAKTLMDMKYSNVTSIDGGWDAWAKAYPDKIETKVIGKEIKKEIKEEIIVDSGDSCGG